MFTLNSTLGGQKSPNIVQTKFRDVLANVAAASTTSAPISLVSGMNDPQITQSQQYSQLVNSRFVNVAYKAPQTKGNTYSFNDPNFMGQVTVYGNISVATSLGYTSTTGFLTVAQDAHIAGDTYTNNLFINGAIEFVNAKGFSFVGNTNAPVLVSVLERVNALYIKNQTPVTYIVSCGGTIYWNTNSGLGLYTATQTSTGFTPFGGNNGHANMAYWNGFQWVAVGMGNSTLDDHSIAVSTDGSKWRGVQSIGGLTPGYFNEAFGVTWNGTYWFVCGDSLLFPLAYSADGLTWNGIEVDYTSNDLVTNVAQYMTPQWIANNGTICITAWQPKSPNLYFSLAYSLDGTTWIPVDSPSSLIFKNGARKVVWNGRYWVAISASYDPTGNNFAYSTDGMNWTGYMCPLVESDINDIAWSADLNMWICGIGIPTTLYDNTLLYSYDGQNWFGRGNSNFTYCKSITWDGTRWHAIGSGRVFNTIDQNQNTVTVTTGFYQVSTDGFHWETNNTAMTGIPYFIASSFGKSGFAQIANSVQISRSLAVQKNLTVNGNVSSRTNDTGALVVNGGIGIAENINAGGNVVFSNTTDSFSTSSGTIIVGGGIGLGANLFVGNNVIIQGKTDAGSINTGTVVISGGIGVAKTMFVGNSVTMYGSQDSYGLKTGALVVQNGGASITQSLFIGNSITAYGNQETTTIGQGALVVSGGASIGKSLMVQVNTTINGTTDSASTSSGTLVLSGGVGIAKSMFIGNSITALGTSDTTSLGTGAFVLSGGASIGKNVIIGNNLTINGTTNSVGTTGMGALQVSGGVGIGRSTTIGESLQVGNLVSILGAIDSYNTNSGTLTVKGGIGVGQSMFVGNSITALGTSDTFSLGTGAFVLSGGASITKNVIIGNTLQIKDQSDNALSVVGGVSVGKNIVITGTATTQSINDVSYNVAISMDNSASLHVLGGASITKSLRLGGQLTIDNSNGSTSQPNALCVHGVVQIDGNVSMGSNVIVQSSQDSNATSNGALVVQGGMGVHGNVNMGGNLAVSKNTLLSGNVDICGNLTVQRNVNFQTLNSIYVGGSLLNTLLPTTLFQGIDTSFSQNVAIFGTRDVTNTTGTGALMVTGGVSIGANLLVGKSMLVQSTLPASTYTNAALVVTGGVGIGAGLNVNGTITTNGCIFQNINGQNLYLGNQYTFDAASTNNTIVGCNALLYSVNVNNNSAFGSGSLYNSKGNYNTSIGSNAMQQLTTGSNGSPDYNTAIGYNAGYYTGSSSHFSAYNTFLGANTCMSPNQYSYSSAVGYGAVITSDHQIVLGTSAETVTIPGTFSIPGGFSLGTTTATEATQTGTGTLIVYGGASTTGNIIVGNMLTVLNTSDRSIQTMGGIYTTGNISIGTGLTVGSGITIRGVSDSYNQSTAIGALVVVGGVGIGGSLTLAGNLVASNTTNSVGQTTGALVVTGGVGVARDVWVGGNLNAVQAVNMATGTVSGNLTLNGNVIIPGYTVHTGNLTLNGNTMVYGNTTFYGNVFQKGNYTVTGNASLSTTTVAGNLTVNGNTICNGNVYMSQNNGIIFAAGPSINVGSDSNLHVSTGITVGGSLYFPNNSGIYVNGNPIVVAGFTVPDISGVVRFHYDGDSTYTGDGTIVCVGGAGFGKSVNVGGNLSANQTIHGQSLLVDTSATIQTISVTSTGVNALQVAGGVGIAGNTMVGNCLTVNGLVDAVSTNSGALQISGGVGIQKNLVVGNSITMYGTVFNAPNARVSIGGNTTISGKTTITGNASIGGRVDISGSTTIGGSLVLGGGLTVNGAPNNFITANFNSAKTNALYSFSTANKAMYALDQSGNVLQYDYVNNIWNSTVSPVVINANGVNSSTALQWNGYIWVLGTSTTPYNHASTNYLYYSTDASNWTPTGFTGFGTYAQVTSVAWNGSIWVAGGETTDGTKTISQCVAYSYDGMVWNLANGANMNICQTVASNGTLWIAGGLCVNKNQSNSQIINTNTLYSSHDGINWLPVPVQPRFYTMCYSIAVLGNTWVALGDNEGDSTKTTMIYSNNGTNWFDVSGGNTIFNYNPNGCVTTNGSIWLAGSYQPYLLAYSYDSQTWSKCKYSNSNGYVIDSFLQYQIDNTGIIWNNDLQLWFAALVNTGISNSTVILTSPDGILWTRSNFSESSTITTFANTSTNTGQLYVQSQATLSSLNVINNGFVSGSLYVTGNIYYNSTIPCGTGSGSSISTLKDVSFNGNIIVASNTPSYDLSSGSLIVFGGSAIKGNTNIGGNLWVNGNTSLGGNLWVGGNTNLGGNLWVNGNTSLGGNLWVNGNINSSNISTSTLRASSDTTLLGNLFVLGTTPSISTNTGALQVSGGVSILGDTYTGGNVNITNTTASTSTGTGALQVSGGVSILGNTYTSGIATITNTTPSTATGTGALQVNGGVSILGNTYTSGITTITNSTASISTGTGALQVMGGVGIAGDSFIGGNVTIVSTTPSGATGTGALQVTGGVSILGDTYTGGNLIITTMTPSTGTGTGALQVMGGVSILGDTYTNGSISVSGVTLSADVNNGIIDINGGLYIFGDSYTDGNLTIHNTDLYYDNTTSKFTIDNNTRIIGNLSTDGNIIISSTRQSNSTNTGALVVNGGVGIRGNTYIGGNLYVTGLITSAAGVVGGTAISTTSSGTVTTLNVNNYINSSLIQYYPFDNCFNNLATGLSVFDLSYTNPPTFLGSTTSSINLTLIPNQTMFMDIIDTTSIGSYVTFENTPAVVNQPKFGSYTTLFTSNINYVTNSTAITIPGSFSIAFWISLCGYIPSGNVSIVNIIPNSGGANITLDLNRTQNIFNSLGQTISIPLASSSWQHVAWVYDSGTSVMYLNGQPTAPFSGTLPAFQTLSSISVAPGKFSLGNNTSGSYVSSYEYELQQYRLYGRALSGTDVSNLYFNTASYYSQVMIPSTSAAIVGGDFGVAGNTIITNKLGIGMNNPQYTVDICGNLNVRGALSTLSPPQVTYTSLPNFSNSYQVGYIQNGSLYNTTDASMSKVNNIGNLSVPMGVWMINAQGVFQTQNSGMATISTAILSLYDSSQGIQPQNLGAANKIPPFAFSEMYFRGGVLDVCNNFFNGYYSTNITQVLKLSNTSNTLYLNSYFDGSGTGLPVVLDISSSYFTATRIA
jgi:hypothetical protein